MSESETVDSGAEPEDADNPGVPEVLDALEPLTDQMETLAGFAVKPAPEDPDVVEVRITLAPPRSPKESAMARGMLQGHGFAVRKELRAGNSTHVRSVLRVRADPEEPDTEPRGDGEQDTF